MKETNTKIWSENFLERRHLDDLRGWKDNIKLDLTEMGCEDGIQIGVAHNHIKWWALVLALRNFYLRT